MNLIRFASYFLPYIFFCCVYSYFVEELRNVEGGNISMPSVMGVSTSMRNTPRTKPTIIAQKAALGVEPPKKTPRKKTTKIGGTR